MSTTAAANNLTKITNAKHAENEMRSNANRPVIVLAICAVCLTFVLTLWWMKFGPLKQAEFIAQDWQVRHGRKTPLDDRLVFIGIDKPNYGSDFSNEELQQEPVLRELQSDFPWSRAVWARLLEKLSDAGAKVVVFDLVFATPGDGDGAFRQVIEKHKDRVVLGYNLLTHQTDRGYGGELQLPISDLVATASTNSPVQDSRLGFVNIWPDDDETFRKVNFRLTGEQTYNLLPPNVLLESLDARALEQFGRPDLVPQRFDSLPIRFTAPPGKAFPVIPVGYVLSPKLWEKNYGNDFFKGKIVMIGPTAEIFQDYHDTPFSDPKAMAGPEIHMQIINAALHGEFLRELSLFSTGAFIVIAGLIATVLCLLLRTPLRQVAAISMLGAVVLFGTKISYDRLNLILPIVQPLLTVGLIGSAVLVFDFVVERLERMKLRHTMGLYFSPRVLEAVLADPGSMQAKKADVTLLLTDLRNSTPLAEILGPKGMFELLNHVFEVQTKAIMSEEGNLEHFLGDQFLSYWGAPQSQANAADRALKAAMKLITSMENLRPTFALEVQKLFGFGVALHSGSVLVGNKGSAQRLDYGLVGDAVNEAARIESLTKLYCVRMLVSRETLEQLTRKPIHRLLDRVIVKGKSDPVELFECENPCTPPNFGDICSLYASAFKKYSVGNFAEAQSQFDKLSNDFADSASQLLGLRCAELAARPHDNWQGIWKMDAK